MNLIGRKFENSRLDVEIFVYEVDSEEWFIGKNIALSLGYKDPSGTVKYINDTYKKKVYIKTIENIENVNKSHSEIQTINNNITLINEFGLYQMVSKSTLLKAQEFQKWIYEEVLPSLRKNNYYIDKENINQNQIERLKESLFDLCEEGKISLGKASKKLFGNEQELKNRLINIGLLNYDNCVVKQIKLKASNDKEYDLFCYNVSGTYTNGIVKEQLQVSLTNAGYIYIKNKLKDNKDFGLDINDLITKQEVGING